MKSYPRMNHLSSIGSHTLQNETIRDMGGFQMTGPPTLNGSSKGILNNKTAQRLWQGGSFKIRTTDSDNNKSTFLEKLQNLENGVCNDKSNEEDPYAFQDVEQIPLLRTQEANDVIKAVSSNVKGLYKFAAQNAPVASPETQKCFVKSSVPTFSVSPKTRNDDSLPSYRQSDILPRHPLEAAKVRSPLFAPIKTAQSAAHAKLYQSSVNKQLNFKSGAIATQRSSGGKPMNFGKSQMSKLAIAKIEKTIESKSKHVSKGKPLGSLQKTASISKLLNKPKKPVHTRSASLDSDATLSNQNTSRLKTPVKKSLLEESLLGLKPNDGDRNRGCTNSGRNTAPLIPPPVQTAATTVHVPPRSRPYVSRDRLLKHESLQRIWGIRNKMKLLKRNYQHFGLLVGDLEEQNAEAEGLLFRNYWFSLYNDYDSFAGNMRKRDAKLAQLKTELRQKLRQQQWRYRNEYRDSMSQLLISTARRRPNLAAFLIRLDSPEQQSSRSCSDRLPVRTDQPGLCEFLGANGEVCQERALPCVQFCRLHVVHYPKQLIFTSCNVPVPPDNRACGAPLLDKISDLGLCVLHQRLDSQIQKPKKPAPENFTHVKKSRSMSSSRTGRSRKRKRHAAKDKKESGDSVNRTDVELTCSRQVIEPIIHPIPTNALVLSKSDVDEAQDVEVGEEVLPLDSADLAHLTNQETKLLEEHDLNNVLSHIPAELNDLFTADKEEYEPTPQETEELERALEAVDKDVKSLETLSQTQAILDMLEDPAIVQTLATMPDVVPVLYQNGFANLGQLEPSLCTLHPDIASLPIPSLPPHADLLQS